MRMKIRKLIRVWLDGFRYWKCWPHEICHYLAARMLGLRAEIGPCVTRFGPCSRKQKVIVSLAPALAGVLPLAVCLWQLTHAVPDLRLFWGLTCLSGVFWFVACGNDFWVVWKLLVRR